MDTNYNSSYNKSSYNTNYKSAPELVAYSADRERVIFYRKTYTYVALALLAFILLETVSITFGTSNAY